MADNIAVAGASFGDRLERESARLSGRYDLLIKLAFPILLGVAGWAGMSITDHEARLGVVEAGLYTPQQARSDAREADQVRDALRGQIGALQVGLASSQASGAETVKRLDRLEHKLDRILAELTRR